MEGKKQSKSAEAIAARKSGMDKMVSKFESMAEPVEEQQAIDKAVKDGVKATVP